MGEKVDLSPAGREARPLVSAIVLFIVLDESDYRCHGAELTGSRRRAGTVLGGRRRDKRPRSPEDEGRWTTGDGMATGHGRRRTREDDK